MEKLFEDKERINLGYAQHQQDAYDFYDKSAIEKFSIIRDRLNDWFSRYPNESKKQLKGDFKSNFDSAFFELFVHELFVRQGFLLTPHPVVPNSTKNPDFLAKKGDIELYLEAKVATDKSNEERSLETRRNIIYDAINEIRCPGYGISMRSINFLSNRQAKLSRIKHSLENDINRYGATVGSRVTEIYNERQRDYIQYVDEDIEVIMSLWPCSIELSRPIISYLSGSYMGGCAGSIRSAIKAKGYKYGNLDRPYIICVNSISNKQTYTEDVYDALFGYNRNKSFESINDINQVFNGSGDGLFGKMSSHSYSSISGIFITSVFSSNIEVADHWLVKHPFSSNDFDFNNLELSFIHIDKDNIRGTQKKSIGDVMEHSNSYSN